MVSRENLIRELLNRNRKKNLAKTKKLNKNKRWIYENNRGLLFIYNMNNRPRQVSNRNIVYRNNGKRIVSVRPSYGNYVPARTGGYRVPPRRRRRYAY
jgi:hypothetical protein